MLKQFFKRQKIILLSTLVKLTYRISSLEATSNRNDEPVDYLILCILSAESKFIQIIFSYFRLFPSLKKSKGNCVPKTLIIMPTFFCHLRIIKIYKPLILEMFL